MAKEQAEKFLKEMLTNEKVRDYLKMQSELQEEQQPFALYAKAAASAGYDVTPEELKEALISRRQMAAKQTDGAADAIRELSAAELDQIAGGFLWGADDSRIDGHELYCALTWHDFDWCKKYDDWCTYSYWFKEYCS